MASEIDFSALRWFKATASADDQACVEVAHVRDGRVALRDSKDRSKAPQVFLPDEWDAFLDGVRKGEFDRPEA